MNLSTSSHQPAFEGSAENGFGKRPRAIRFVDLVFECDAIAVGRIVQLGPLGASDTHEYLIFEVIRSLRRSLPNQIHITLPTAELQTGTFHRGETAVLFLTQAEGAQGKLFGFGDTGKWPRTSANWVFTAGHVQPMDQVVSIVEGLLKIDTMNRYEDRAHALISKLFMNNALGQIAALQYTADFDHWPTDRLQGEIDLSTVSSLLSARFVLNKTHLDFAAEIELLQLLELVPKSVALPEWIERLMHDDVAIRDTAFTALQTAIEKDFGYDSRASEELRRNAVSLWQEWLDEHLPAYLKQDVPKLLHELRSTIMLRRQAANLLLCVISRQDVGFVADDVENKREVAIKRWEDWWKSTLSQL